MAALRAAIRLRASSGFISPGADQAYPWLSFPDGSHAAGKLFVEDVVFGPDGVDDEKDDDRFFPFFRRFEMLHSALVSLQQGGEGGLIEAEDSFSEPVQCGFEHVRYPSCANCCVILTVRAGKSNRNRGGSGDRSEIILVFLESVAIITSRPGEGNPDEGRRGCKILPAVSAAGRSGEGRRAQ